MKPCIICYGTSKDSQLLESSSEQDREALLRRFFELLTRHVGLIGGSGDLHGSNNNTDPGGDETRGIPSPGKIIKAGLLSCEECSKIMESFCDLYQQMKRIELLLNWKLKMLENKLRGKDKGKVPVSKELIRYCAQKLQVGHDGVGGGDANTGPEEVCLLIDFRRDLIKKCKLIINDIGQDKQRTTFPKITLDRCQTRQKFPSSLLPANDDYEGPRINDNDDSSTEVKSEPEGHSDYDSESDDASQSSKTGNGIPKEPQITRDPTSGKLKCGLCPTEFTWRRHGILHHQHVHLRIRQFKCITCNKTFPRKYNLSRHLQNRRKQCKSFDVDQDEQLPKPKLKKHFCSMCQKGFCRFYNLRRHLKDVHPTSSLNDIRRNLVKKCRVQLRLKFKGAAPNNWETQPKVGSTSSNFISADEGSTMPVVKTEQEDFSPFEDDKEIEVSNESSVLQGPASSKRIPCNPIVRKLEKCQQSHEREDDKPADENPNNENSSVNDISIFRKSGKGIPEGAQITKDRQSGKFQCGLCPTKFPSRAHGYLHHRHVHLRIRLFKCPTCSKRFARKCHLSVHLQSKTNQCKGELPGRPPKPSKFLCPVCEKEFGRLHHMKRHLENLHSKAIANKKRDPPPPPPVPDSIQIEANSENVTALYTLDVGGNEDSSTVPEPPIEESSKNTEGQQSVSGNVNKCPVCSKSFAEKHGLSKHYENDHGDPGKIKLIVPKFDCPCCGKYFGRKSHLKRHLKNIHPNKELPKPTTLAQIDSSSKEDGSSQNKESNQIHKCDICNKEFRKRRTCLQHKKTVHFGIRHMCHKCGKLFTQESNLIAHQRGDTCTIGSVMSEGQVARCHICQKEFDRPRNLHKHLSRAHNTVQDNRCQQCGMGFAHPLSLQRHVRCAHEQKRDHLCDICGAGFPARNRLNFHRKKVHHLTMEGVSKSTTRDD